MNKKDALSFMSKNAGITHLQAEKALQALIQAITYSLKKGERVTFSGFGSFEIKKRKGRKGRNPKTGAPISIPPKAVIKFNPSPDLKDSLL